MFYLYILLAMLILLFMIAYILSKRDIMAPSVLMVTMFIIGTLFVIFNAESWGLNYQFMAALYTISGIFVYTITEFFIRILFLKQSHQTTYQPAVYEMPKLKKWKLYAIILFNMIVVAWYFLEIRKLVGGSNIFTMFQEYRRLGIYSIAGRDVKTVGGLVVQFLKIVEGSGYVAAYLLAGNLVGKVKNRSVNFLLLILLSISVLPGILSAGRTQMLKISTSFIIGYYILWHQKNGWHRNFSWKMVRFGGLSIFLGIPAFYYSLQLLGRSTTKNLLTYASYYIGGGIALFSEYIKSPTPRAVWGEESLYNLLKVFKLLGLSPGSTIYNLEFRLLGNDYSNTYSFFRRPLHDFGTWGMYLFVAGIAIFFATIYYGKIKYRPRTENTIKWTIIYMYFYYWIVSSPILQYSVAYISVGTVTNLIVILILYKFITEENRKLIFVFNHHR